METRKLIVGWLGDGRTRQSAFRPDTAGLAFSVAEDCAKAGPKTGKVCVKVTGEKAQLDALAAKYAGLQVIDAKN